MVSFDVYKEQSKIKKIFKWVDDMLNVVYTDYLVVAKWKIEHKLYDDIVSL